MVFLALLVFPLVATAGVFDEDNRVDTIQASNFHQELARSVPALVQKHRIAKISADQFALTGTPMAEFNMCSDQPFVEEKNIANCSASLIADDLVLTAAHCFASKGYECETYSVVFDYLSGSNTVSQDQVYNCKEVVFSQFDLSIRGIDLAVIKLDRKVIGRKPIKLDLEASLKVGDPLSMIGYPLGISQKVVDTGEVLSIDPKNVSFKHNLDTFSVNSGGPIFNASGEQVGVLVRGTSENFTKAPGRTCQTWGVAKKSDYAEGNDLTALQDFLTASQIKNF